MKEEFKEFIFNEKPKMIINEVFKNKLPDDYLNFMKQHNGGEGSIGKNNYGRLFKLEELETINKEYNVQNNWPGNIIIGTDGGDSLWAYNYTRKKYCQIDANNISEDTYYTISNSFESFIINMDKELDN